MLKMMLLAGLLATPVLVSPVLTAPVLAQTAKPAAKGAKMAPAAEAPSTGAYRDAMKTMMEKMDTPFTGNADHDFVTGMLPHHQGAIDMAHVELQYGRDPALRNLAREIIASQSKEEAFMRGWLARHPRP